MSITKIEINNQSAYNLGDDCTDDDAAGFRQWLTEQLEARFPGADVLVTDRTGKQLDVACGECDECDSDAHNEVGEFVAECWDRCPWDWVKQP